MGLVSYADVIYALVYYLTYMRFIPPYKKSIRILIRFSNNASGKNPESACRPHF